MADTPIGSYAPVSSILPERDRTMPRQEKVYDPSTKKQGGDKKGGAGKKGDDNQSASDGHGHEDISDEISILGIPKEEMSESVRDAINVLLDEVNFLKGELAKAHGHEAYLEEQVETENSLHVLRVRALAAKIVQAVHRVEDENAPYSFIYITIKNGAATSIEFGKNAFDELLVQAAGALNEGIEQGDILGQLENNDFGIILPGNTIADAQLKAESLMLTMAGRKLMWKGATLDIDAGFGLAEIKAGDVIESVRARAIADHEQKNP